MAIEEAEISPAKTVSTASIVYCEAGSDDYASCALVRSLTLAMTPVDAGTRAPAVEQRGREPGVTWYLLAGNGVRLAVRARDFADRQAARRDAMRMIARAGVLTPYPVSGRRGHHAWWLALDGSIALVAARPTSPSRAEPQAHSVARLLGRAEARAR